MKSVAFLLIQPLVLIAKSLRSNGITAVIAENLLLKLRLIVLGRSRQKAPNLITSERFVPGTLSLFNSTRRRLSKVRPHLKDSWKKLELECHKGHETLHKEFGSACWARTRRPRLPKGTR